ncbi:DgyrCDS10410 [Dimorphilus gyrociliatus]|uniref:DgyrCDS10410 n=1 Tax=Dimorphilus gyrociliatus TaxID=2664684 RepID=A0A7I8W028_9ANNE|nr:DgyrCDS10410 [Dimorphilus gyrociliatus]
MINLPDSTLDLPLPPPPPPTQEDIADKEIQLKERLNEEEAEDKPISDENKLQKKIVLSKQHLLFLIIQVISFVIGLITLFLSSFSLSTIRYDPIIKVFSVVNQSANFDEYSSLAIANILVIVGTILKLFLIVFGFFGALWNIGTILEVYILLINIVFMMQSSAIVLASKFHTQNTERLNEGLHIHLAEYYKSKPLLRNGELQLDDNLVSVAWDTAQFHLKCCGVRQSINDYSTDPNSFQHSEWSSNTIDPGIDFRPRYPPSCCVSSNGISYPFERNSRSLGIKAVYNWRKCMIDGDPEVTYTTSCFKAIRNRIQSHIQYTLGSCTFNVAALILCIISALRLLRITPI